MGPRKEVQRKRRHEGEGSSRRSEPSHPLASWFNNSQALENYITKWEKRQFVTPRYRVIPLATVANLCGLSMEGYRFMGEIKADESWGPYAL
ncbi:hypothetical protein PIB30_051526 [Stylosanthes scabra]|uniref:Uncharacterized protein n=1 Tax=Stylosanthes scabra TaxID=79078 RepID=A0ABU6UKS3_9FABA|nr:hypothetical protein [Stylosanthes scabra]